MTDGLATRPRRRRTSTRAAPGAAPAQRRRQGPGGAVAASWRPTWCSSSAFVHRAGGLRLLDQPARLRLHAARTSRSSAWTTTPSCSPPARVILGDFWDSMRATGIFTVLSVPLLLVLPLRRRPAAEPEVPRPEPLPGAVLRAVRPGRGRGRRALAVPARPQHRRWSTIPRRARAAGRHPVAHRRCRGPGSSLVGVTVWWTLGLQRGDLPRRAAGHPAGALRGGPGRRGERLAEFRNVTLPGLRPVLVVRDDGDDHRLGQHVRAVLPDDPGGARARRPAPRSSTSPTPACGNSRWVTAAAMSYILTVFLMLHQRRRLLAASGERKNADEHAPPQLRAGAGADARRPRRRRQSGRARGQDVLRYVAARSSWR